MGREILFHKRFQTSLKFFHRIPIPAGDRILRQSKGVGDFCKCQFFPMLQNDNFILISWERI